MFLHSRKRIMAVKAIIVLNFLSEFEFIKGQLLEVIDPQFKDINEMFPSFTQKPDPTVLDRPPDVIFRNISIDLENLDMDKFRRKLDGYRSKIAEFDRLETNSSNQIKDARRIPYYPYDVSRTDYGAAHEHVVKSKCLDMSLQVIYMARHKIKQLESMPYFNRHDTSYRIAFLYRRLRKTWRLIMEAWTSMRKKRFSTSGRYAWAAHYLIVHHKVVILHVEFLYMWWVMVNVHDKYKIAHFIPNTYPTTTQPPQTINPKYKGPS